MKPLEVLPVLLVTWMDFFEEFTKNFRYLKWRNPEYEIRLVWGVGFPLDNPYIQMI